jgi:uncharacterized protein (TIGR03083 family)
VPTCPDWTRDDLLWHLAEVQWFWGTVVGDQLTDTEQVDRLELERPGDEAGLWALFWQASRDLVAALAAVPPSTPAWSWANDQTVGFTLRRQAHEALIHRVDAELIASDRSPVDPRLAADGVDELLRIMYGDAPGWAEVTAPDAGSVRVVVSDVDRSWVVTPARFVGVSPTSGKHYDEPFLRVADADPSGPVAGTVTGTAADLDCWLWNRPGVEAVQTSGDPAVLARFGTVIGQGVQ